MNSLTVVITVCRLSPTRLRAFEIVLEQASKIGIPVIVSEQYMNPSELEPVDEIVKKLASPNVRHITVQILEEQIWKTRLINEAARLVTTHALWSLDADMLIDFRRVVQMYRGEALYQPFEYVVHLTEQETVDFITTKTFTMDNSKTSRVVRPPIGPSSFIISMDLFNKLGGMDDTFGFGFEEVDLMWRAFDLALPETCGGMALHLHHDHHNYTPDGHILHIRPETRNMIWNKDFINPNNWVMALWEKIERIEKEKGIKAGVHFIAAPGRPRPPPHRMIPPKQIPNVEPTVAEMMANFGAAMIRWGKSGFKLVDEATYKQRITICRSCPLWDEKARGGLGKCRHHKCGCTRTKHHLATERCPLGKWERVN